MSSGFEEERAELERKQKVVDDYCHLAQAQRLLEQAEEHGDEIWPDKTWIESARNWFERNERLKESRTASNPDVFEPEPTERPDTQEPDPNMPNTDCYTRPHRLACDEGAEVYREFIGAFRDPGEPKTITMEFGTPAEEPDTVKTYQTYHDYQYATAQAHAEKTPEQYDVLCSIGDLIDRLTIENIKCSRMNHEMIELHKAREGAPHSVDAEIAKLQRAVVLANEKRVACREEINRRLDEAIRRGGIQVTPEQRTYGVTDK